MFARVVEERNRVIAMRSTGAYLVPRIRHDEFGSRARSISLSLLLKSFNSPAGRRPCVGSKINHRDARAARDVALCDRENKLCVRSAKGHIVAFTATFAYIREAINILRHNLRRAVHALRDDVSPRAPGMHACSIHARAHARASRVGFETSSLSFQVAGELRAFRRNSARRIHNWKKESNPLARLQVSLAPRGRNCGKNARMKVDVRMRAKSDRNYAPQIRTFSSYCSSFSLLHLWAIFQLDSMRP